MNTPPRTGFIATTVGEMSPFPPLPPDQLTVAMSLAHPIPIIIVSLPEVTHDDIVNIKAPTHAVALRRSATLPSGTLLLVLKVSEKEVWSIGMPFLDDAANMKAWASVEIESNDALVVLVDAGTQIIMAQRTVGLPPRLLEMARQGILDAPQINELAAIKEVGRLSDLEIWEQSTRWQDVDNSGFYTMVAEAPLQK